MAKPPACRAHIKAFNAYLAIVENSEIQDLKILPRRNDGVVH
jgi:hypothetical protein